MCSTSFALHTHCLPVGNQSVIGQTRNRKQKVSCPKVLSLLQTLPVHNMFTEIKRLIAWDRVIEMNEWALSVWAKVMNTEYFCFFKFS